MEAAQRSRNDTYVLAGIAAAVAVLHVLTNGRYGSHRDELQFLSDARHLDWGFVACRPLTSGGGGLAQIAAALAVALSPLPLFEVTEFQYTTFDYLWWVLIAWFMIRLLKSDNPRWWMAIGAAMGMGLETRYSITFFIGRAVRNAADAGPPLSGKRVVLGRHGTGDCDLSAEPDLAGAARFLWLWIPGLAWVYLIPLALFWAGKRRDYYLAAAYPMRMAMGAVVAFIGLAAFGAYARALILPFASSGPLVRTVASIRDSLPPEQRETVGVLVRNYGEQGLLGVSQKDAAQALTSCRVAGHNGSPYGSEARYQSFG